MSNNNTDFDRIDKIQDEHPGYLVIVSTKMGCPTCLALRGSGFYEELDETLDLGDYGNIDHRYAEELDKESNKPVIFTLMPFVPGFMYMTKETYNRAISSGADYKSVVNGVCFYNFSYNLATGRLDEKPKYKGFTVEAIQQFCDDSAIELDSRRKAQQARSPPSSKPVKNTRAIMLYDKK